MKKRTVALLCAAVALLGVVFGGTMAWLSSGSQKPLVNTFSTADITLGLTETEGEQMTGGRAYTMAPGAVLPKDPTVTLTEDSASCYLFVKVEEKNNPDHKPISWTPASGWEPVEGAGDAVYCYEFDKSNLGTLKPTDGLYQFPFLENNQVTVSGTLTKTQLDGYEKNPASRPQLTFTAYAIQMDYLDESLSSPKLIWEKALESATKTA